MPLPEGYLPREGDVLILHGTVCYNVRRKGDDDGEEGLHVFVRPQGYYADIRVPLKDVVGIFARKWEEGDRVTIEGDEGGSGVVLAVHGTMVWIKYSRPDCSDTFGTYEANALVAGKPDPLDESFVEEAPEPPPAAPGGAEG